VTLKNFLHILYPNTDILEDFRNPDMLYEKTGFPMELDLYIPQFKLAFEYQGLQHYEAVEIFHTNLIDRNRRDAEKKEKCALTGSCPLHFFCKKKLGITLIPVPYWWDHKLESLNATIYKYRPDLFTVPPTEKPIPTEYMHKFTKPTNSNFPRNFSQ
jgi:hypothetical protein